MSDDSLAPVHVPSPPDTAAHISSLTIRAALLTAAISLVVGSTVNAVPALIGKTEAEPVSCVEVLAKFRADVSGYPDRLPDYLAPGDDGVSVLSQDDNARKCGIDEGNLRRWAAQAPIPPADSSSGDTGNSTGSTPPQP